MRLESNPFAVAVRFEKRNAAETVDTLSDACSLGLSATIQQYFSLRTNQPPATSQQYFSLRTSQHQPPAKRTGCESESIYSSRELQCSNHVQPFFSW
jgi:hypothetical protein